MGKPRKPSTGISDGGIPQVEPHARTTRAAAGKNNIRHWRTFRGIETQGELALLTKRIDPRGRGVTRATISRLECGELRYNEDHLSLLAVALRTTCGALIGINPFMAADVVTRLARLNTAQQRRAIKYLDALTH